jgi:hypothetical protein
LIDQSISRKWRRAVVFAVLVGVAALPAARAATAPEFPYVHGKRLRLLGAEPLGELRRPLFAPLLGTDLPLAIPSPDGGRIIYHAWDGAARGPGAPVLRVYAREGGPERLLARGAQSAAWRRDGALAYMQADVPRYVPNTLGGNYGQVVVRRSLDAAPVAWTGEQRRRYVVLGWARRTLLVQIEPSHVTLDRRLPGVYALDVPGRLRPLPLSELVAISPDGRRALGTHRVGDGPVTAVHLVDLARGRVLASLPLRFVAHLGRDHGSGCGRRRAPGPAGRPARRRTVAVAPPTVEARR